MNLFSLTPAKVKSCVESCMQARLVPFIQGSPGIGKSNIVKQIADEYRLKMVDLRLSSMDPTDLQGLPMIQNGKAQFNPYEMFPLEDSLIPEGYEGWLLFLDEFNSAPKAVQSAAYRVVLDREIGQHKLHSKCFVVAAGNKSTDNAIVNRLSTAMASRVIHLNMEVNFDNWRYDFAIPHGIDERIIAYLSMYPMKLMDFDPDKEDQTFCSPRTWEFTSKLLKVLNKKELSEDDIPLLAGAITIEQASAFVQFCKVYKNIISIKDIIKNPDIDPPSDAATLWAVIIHLVSAAKDLKDIEKFLSKCPITFRIVFIRSIFKKAPNIQSDPVFLRMTSEIGAYCFGEE